MEAGLFIVIFNNMEKRIELLLGALAHYSITVSSIGAKTVAVQNGYEIEVEPNGLYRLTCNQMVIAPFDNIDELCLFITQA